VLITFSRPCTPLREAFLACAAAILPASADSQQASSSSFAGSATWLTNPATGTGTLQPTGRRVARPMGLRTPATFGVLQHNRHLPLGGGPFTEVNGIVFNGVRAPVLRRLPTPGVSLLISGVAITNNFRESPRTL